MGSSVCSQLSLHRREKLIAQHSRESVVCPVFLGYVFVDKFFVEITHMISKVMKGMLSDGTAIISR